MANTYLSKTFSSGDSSGNGQKKFTVSAWVKRAGIGSHQDIVSAYKASNGFQCDAIRIYNTDLFGSFSHSDSGGSGYNVRSNAVLRDTNAWYHLVTAVDTTQSTASDRVKLYINGEQVTSFNASTYPAQDESLIFGMPIDAVHEIGAVGTSSYFDGVMSHVHICFNQQYDASAFGETDSTTGEWKIKTSPSVSYGSIGGWYLKDEANGTDYSSNSNTYSVNGTLTKTEDNPSNVFATFNPLAKHGITTSTPSDFMANGNTTFYTPSDNNARKGLFLTSLGATSGKYYCEYKQGGGGRLITGICNANIFKATNEPYLNSNQSALLYLEINSEIKYDGSNYSTGIQSGTSGDIFGFALDLDNKQWYIHKNGTYFNSGDPTSGATGTGSIISATSTSAFFNHGEMFFCAGDFEDSDYATSNWNFGNGYFGTTAVASAGTNASGIGIFEYDVPTGYTALSTKGLNL